METTFLATPFESTDGHQLYRYRWAPEKPTGEILIVHGYGDHAARYEEVARHLAKNGIAATAIDVRGHGKAAGQRGHVDKFEDYHQDIVAGLGLLETDTPRFILGHSHGGLILLHFLLGRASEKQSLAGILLSNPYLGLEIPVPKWKEVAGNWVYKLYPKFSLPTGLPPGGLSHDPEMVQAYEADELVFDRASVGWFQESTRAQQEVVAGKVPELPSFFVYSDADPIASPKINAEYARRIKDKGGDIILRPGELHEVLHEVKRAEVHQLVSKWVLDRVNKTS